MTIQLPATLSPEILRRFVLALADDELVLGHRDSEWTGYGPILEEDIAFSNIAQDELGHSLVWLTFYHQLGGADPDTMGFAREWKDFTCCRFVSYPKGDFAYTVVRQFLFDVAEEERLKDLKKSSISELRDIAEKLLREEGYHILHTQGLVERLGDATEESHRRMQNAVDAAFPQALGLFEKIDGEEKLVASGVFSGNDNLKSMWLKRVLPVLEQSTLKVAAQSVNGRIIPTCTPDEGGRKGNHTEHLQNLITAMQSVYRSIPGAKW
jgi:ring-1,2-phenylacetyl-CoA epoxidase subunit PaaC